MKKILLVEPNYKNKYPPMGLMKISTYHKMLGDEVYFVKGITEFIDKQIWDRIYITTLFTFDFMICVETINHYKRIAQHVDDIYVGGIMASLMPENVVKATGIRRDHVLVGLFTDTTVVGDDNNINVDQLPLDYDILDTIEYKYPAGDNYFAYTTRGCPNKCAFCAVPILEPKFQITNNIREQISRVEKRYGPKQNLLLLDNNVLNTPNLHLLVDDLCAAGFGKGAKFVDPGVYAVTMMRYHNGERGEFLDKRLIKFFETFKKRIKSSKLMEDFISVMIDAEEAENFAEYMISVEDKIAPIIEKYRSKTAKSRYLDFNQGIDARKINNETMEQLARLCIRPLRIAFDDIRLKEVFCGAVRIAHAHGIKEISNYILYNYKDTPEDLYNRLRINIELNKELGIQIFSFPMKYCPIDYTDRSYVGSKWTKKSLRAISAILQVTKGVVAAGSSFFEKAFGRDVNEFNEILAMPRDFIIYRSHFEKNGLTFKWKNLYSKLNLHERQELLRLTSLDINSLKNEEWPTELRDIMELYFVKYKG